MFPAQWHAHKGNYRRRISDRRWDHGAENYLSHQHDDGVIDAIPSQNEIETQSTLSILSRFRSLLYTGCNKPVS